jgi:alkylhydroperoxidase family enzyme
MPRLRYIEEAEMTDTARELIASAERTGAPDPRVVSIMVRNSKAGVAWVKYWNSLLYDGVLPHPLKEICRILISMEHRCGYCSTVRSKVAQAEGLTEDKVAQLPDFETSDAFTDREKAALRYALRFKSSDHGVDSDEAYDDLRKHFNDEEIIELGLFCGETDGAGKLVRSWQVMSWGEACELNPDLAKLDRGAEAAE